MSQIQVSNEAADPSPPPPPGTKLLYTKSTGLFTMDEFGVVTGPFTGGSGPPTGPAGGSLAGTYPNPTIAAGAVGSAEIAAFAVISGKIGPLAVGTAELANASVTNPKIANDAVQTAQIANSAVTGAKIADGTIGPAKLQNPSGVDKMVYADTASSWAYGYPARVHFGTDPAGPYVARMSVLGDLGAANDPLSLRVVNHAAADASLGYLDRVQAYEVKVTEDLALQVAPTVFYVSAAVPQTVTLPDCRKYPIGTEISFVHIGSANLTILQTGTVGGGFANIVGNPPSFPAATQLVIPGMTKRFATFGAGWFVSREVFSQYQNVPLAHGYSEVSGAGAAHWEFNPAAGAPWIAITASRAVFFPVGLPDGATLTAVEVLLQQTGVDPGLGNRMKVALYRETVNYSVPAAASALVAGLVEATGSLAIQKVSLTGLTEVADPTKSWTILIQSSTGVPAPTGNAVYGVRLTYTL